MRVTTDSKHYENMAAKIREKTGTDATYKPSEMPSGVDEVYKAGQSSMVDESKLIPKTVSGSYISVDDVSEIPHSVGCKVESVNLLKYPYYRTTETINGVTFTDNGDGTITINGTATESTNYHLRYTGANKRDEIKAGTYTLSGANSNNEGIYIYVFVFPEQTGTGTSVAVTSERETRTITVENDAYFGCYISVPAQRNFDNVTVKPMLNRGATALPFTPYVDNLESVSVTRTGKNLCPMANAEYTQVKKVIFDEPLPVGTYTFSGIVTSEQTDYYLLVRCMSGASDTIFAADSFAFKQATETRQSKTVNIYNPCTHFYVYTSNGAVNGTGVNGAFFDFQVNVGTSALPYEPYNGQTFTPSADGTVEGMTSISPYVNIFTDTDGVNIEATYNKSWGIQTEYDRFWDAYQENGKRTNYFQAFGFGDSATHSPWTNQNFKPKYPIKPSYVNNMCANFGYRGDITEAAEFDFSNAWALYSAFVNCPYITRIGVIDCRKMSEGGGGIINNCPILETVDKFIFKSDGTQKMSSLSFASCTSLKNIVFEGKANFNVNFQHSPLSKASIISVINSLYEGSSGLTLTLKLSAVNTAFETSSGAADGSTSAEFAALVATKTNWTITMV